MRELESAKCTKRRKCGHKIKSLSLVPQTFVSGWMRWQFGEGSGDLTCLKLWL